MDFRRILLPLFGQAGVFVLGGLGWLALTHSLYASATVCAIGAVTLASIGLARYNFSFGRDLLRRTQPGATFTSELSRRRLQVLLDQTPSPLLLQPENGQLIAVNRAARQLFDVAYALPVASRKILLGEASGLATMDKQIKWKGQSYAVHLAEMEEEDRQAHLAVLTDISADVRAAEAHALRDLLKVLNHELMNALTPVASMSKSALDLLGDDTPASREAARKALERVVARTEGLTDFVNAYRALTRLPPPLLHAAALDDWLEICVESFEAQWADKGVTFTHNLSAKGLSAVMDEDQLWLCVGNLLNNAAQAALEKADARVRLNIQHTDDQVIISVEDSGGGIKPEQTESVFMPFFTTKPTGTGVGLSLSRQIVQGHGSALTLLSPAETPPDRLGGACFRFHLKRA